MIRKATCEDYKFIAEHLFYAMEDIVYKFIGKEDKESAIQFLEYFAKHTNNQYSYENCFILEYNGIKAGVANLYAGAELAELRKPVLKYIKDEFDRDFIPEDETQSGEIYLDTFGVSPKFRGKGLGTKILTYLIEEFCQRHNQKLGLLVDNDNPKAEKLYLKLGFKKVADKTLMGKPMKHLQIS